jgi:hypothetical protein
MMVSFEGIHGGDCHVVYVQVTSIRKNMMWLKSWDSLFDMPISGLQSGVAGEKSARIRTEPVDLELLNGIQLPCFPATLRAWRTVHIECFTNGQVFSGGVRGAG